MTTDTRLIDGESGKVVHPSSTVTMPIYEFDRIIRKLDEREGQLRECVEFIEKHHRAHYECEDGFFSCPKAPGYFGSGNKDACYCGKDAADALLARIKERENHRCQHCGNYECEHHQNEWQRHQERKP